MAATLQEIGIELIEGSGPATFRDASTVALADGRNFRGDRIVLAVGGHERILPVPGAELTLTSRDIWSLQQLLLSSAAIASAIGGREYTRKRGTRIGPYYLGYCLVLLRPVSSHNQQYNLHLLMKWF